MIKQKVFIPVEGAQDYDVAFFGIKDSKELKGKDKEQEGYFFSTTQLKFFAKKCFDAGRDSFAYEIGDTFEKDEIVHETFIEFFESLNIK